MEADLLACIDTYCSAGVDAAASLTRFCELVPSVVTLPACIRLMAPCLTSTDGVMRKRSTHMLAAAIEAAVNAHALGVFTAQEGHARTLIHFFCDRLGDFPSVAPALRALLALARVVDAVPHVFPNLAVVLAKAVYAELNVQAMEQATRQIVYDVLLHLVTSDVHAAALLAHAPGESPYALDFAVGFVQAMDGEKDPRCLVVCLDITTRLLSASHPLSFSDAVASYAQELFDVTACYFPISFRPPPNDPHGISKETLVMALRRVFAASPRMAPYVVPLLLEKLASSVVDAKLDALETLVACASSYGVGTLAHFWHDIFEALKRETLFPQESPAAHLRGAGAGSSSGSDALGSTTSPWIGFSSIAAATPSERRSVGLLAGAIGMNFSGASELHGNSGYSMYTPNLTRPFAAAAGPTAVAGGGGGGGGATHAGSAVEHALVTVTELSRLLSYHVQSTGMVQEWHDFVSSLTQLCINELRRGADSLLGRACARVLCAIAAASHHALASVMQSVMPVIVDTFENSVASARVPVRVSVLALLAGLLHTVDPGLDHPAGCHPLSPHTAAIYDLLFDTVRQPVRVPASVGVTSSGASQASSSAAEWLSAATEARCIAVAGLCDLAIRPPSPLLALEQKFEIVSHFTVICLEDPDDQFREACLRALCTMASVRHRFCEAVLFVAVPRLIGVVRDGSMTLIAPHTTGAEAALAEPWRRTASSAVGSVMDGGLSTADAGAEVTAAVAASSTAGDWYSDMHFPGLTNMLSRGLYALGQLCCISNLRVQHTVVPQLLHIAVQWCPITASDAQPRATSPATARARLHGVAHGRDAAAVAVAIIETLSRVVFTKATAGATDAVDSFVVFTPDATSAYTSLLTAAASSAAAERGGMGGSGDDGLALSDFGSRRDSVSSASGDERPEVDLSAPAPNPAPAAEAEAGAEAGSGDGPVRQGDVFSFGPLPAAPMAVVPSLAYLLMDSIAPPPCTACAPRDACTDAHGDSDCVPYHMPGRVCGAVELLFRTVAMHASAPVQCALRRAASSVVLAGCEDVALAADAAVREAIAAQDALAMAPAPEQPCPPVVPLHARAWFVPLSAGHHVGQYRLLPPFLMVLACSARGAPVPRVAHLALATARAAFEIPAPQLSACTDPYQRHRARSVMELSRRGALSGAGAAAAGSEPALDSLSPAAAPSPAHTPSAPATRAPSASSCCGDRGASGSGACCASAPAPMAADGACCDKAGIGHGTSVASTAANITRYPVERQRCTVVCAQTMGAVLNRCEATGALAAPFRATVHNVLRIICASSGVGVASLAAVPELAATLAALAPAPVVSAEEVHTRRERGVLCLVWLAKSLSMRGHPLAQLPVEMLVGIMTRNDAAWHAHVPLSQHVIMLAGQGLGVVVADALPRHPFHKDAGAAVQGFYKQKLFAFVYARFHALQNAGWTAGGSAPSADSDASSGSMSDGASDAGGGGGGGGGGLTSAQLMPLLLSLCAMATHLPQALLVSEVDKVLPIVVRALEIMTTSACGGMGSSGSAPAPAPPPASTPCMCTVALSTGGVSAYVEMRDAVANSALLCLRMLVQQVPASIATHLASLVSVLLALSRYSPADGCASPLVRATAIDCLRGLVVLPYHKLHPVRASVMSGLMPALDDPKRAVRRRAAACRNDWTTLTVSGASSATSAGGGGV